MIKLDKQYTSFNHLNFFLSVRKVKLNISQLKTFFRSLKSALNALGTDELLESRKIVHYSDNRDYYLLVFFRFIFLLFINIGFLVKFFYLLF